MPASIPDAIFQSFEEQSDPGTIAPRMVALRKTMKSAGIDGFMVPRADVHQGEYVPASDARLAYISGFTGSAGLAIIGHARAVLCVDSRYTLQAPAQTDTAIFEIVDTTDTKPAAVIGDMFERGMTLGFDPWLHTPEMIEKLQEDVAASGVTLKPVDNLIDAIWEDRPAAPDGGLEILGANRTGREMGEKLDDLSAAMDREGADAVVLTLPESLCWLFNIRGRDVPHNPFVLGFAIVPREGRPQLYLPAAKLTQANREALRDRADLADKREFPAALSALAGAGKAVWFDPQTAPMQVKSLLGEGGAKLVARQDPVLLPKARKNEVELSGMRHAHRLDAVAMAKFLAWFDRTAPGGELTEIEIVCQLEAFRRECEDLVDISFETISGAGSHGAVVHYRVSEKTNRTLVPGELMLVDSGGQYLGGTTDITRTMASGEVSAEQKDNFTRVLKGMIAISRARFPRGTSGAQLDILARQFLWQAGRTYNHGTGHGVGAYLSVHEGPIGISPRYMMALEEGMVLSNEPGFYREGEYGIRIENLIVVRQSEVGDGKYLEFETLTLAPIDTRLIDTAMLDVEETDWLNAYHTRVYDEVSPLLDAQDRDWLKAATAPL